MLYHNTVRLQARCHLIAQFILTKAFIYPALPLSIILNRSWIKPYFKPLVFKKHHAIGQKILASIVFISCFFFTALVYAGSGKPVAMLEYATEGQGTDKYYFNQNGNCFKATENELALNLPTLVGDPEKSHALWKQYNTLNQYLRPYQLNIAVLNLASISRCHVKLSNGIQLFFLHTNLMAQLQRLLDLHPELLHQPEKIAVLDLRYPDGIAITWHENR